ncbi:hypothetical protein RRG08_000423 [Elysia crispata]|uniref:Uncharacterized protein n=1 Tax=Elysia crispata TaxID=231223 RepID=A0AAE0ZRW7_9GAST|nr:hypothetical protein RRG08_000423 [Elysia crispata]
MKAIITDELTRCEKLGPSAVKESVTGNNDLTVFWKSVANHDPALAPVRESVTWEHGSDCFLEVCGKSCSWAPSIKRVRYWEH